MKKYCALFVMALALAAAGVSLAADNPHLGTWKLNEAKSKIPAGMGKNTTVTYTSEGDKIKVTTEGVDKDGNATHGTWVGNFDGKAYAVEGNPGYDMFSYKMVNAHTNAITAMKDGKTVFTGRITVAADGKSRTVSITMAGKGKKMKEMSFYDKE